MAPRSKADRSMLILGIESSCDETACAIVRNGHTVLSNVIASQHELHREYAGVVPEIASRAHVERLIPVLRASLKDAGVELTDLNAIAVGNRPGLIGSLVTGVTAAKALSWSLGLPLVGVDHIQAHLAAGLLSTEESVAPCEGNVLFPALGLVVSGGHTALYNVRSPLHATRIGTTIDDAIGEAYDKAATMLGLDYPGGPIIDKLARTGNSTAHKFPVSRLDKESLDFSFSGLKTALLYAIRGIPQRIEGQRKPVFPRNHHDLSDSTKADIAASFQAAACKAIVLKTQRALNNAAADAKALIVGGGVSANSHLRQQLTTLAHKRKLELVIPEMQYCTDNAAMIAALGWHRLQAGEQDDLSLAAAPSGTLV